MPVVIPQRGTLYRAKAISCQQDWTISPISRQRYVNVNITDLSRPASSVFPVTREIEALRYCPPRIMIDRYLRNGTERNGAVFSPNDIAHHSRSSSKTQRDIDRYECHVWAEQWTRPRYLYHFSHARNQDLSTATVFHEYESREAIAKRNTKSLNRNCRFQLMTRLSVVCHLRWTSIRLYVYTSIHETLDRILDVIEQRGELRRVPLTSLGASHTRRVDPRIFTTVTFGQFISRTEKRVFDENKIASLVREFENPRIRESENSTIRRSDDPTIRRSDDPTTLARFRLNSRSCNRES